MQNMFNTFSSTTEYLQQQATWHLGGLLESCVPTFVLKQYCSLLNKHSLSPTGYW